MSQIASELADYLLAGDQQAAIQCIQQNEDMTNLMIFHQLITPAMQYIGELWEKNEITVADEHLATATCDFVFSRLFSWQGDQSANGKKAILLCLEGEQHYLGLKMVSSLFVEHGWNVRFFGPNLPLEYALETAEKWKPDVIGLSVSIVYHLPHLKHYVKHLSSLSNRPVIMLGGRLAATHDLRPYCDGNTMILKDLLMANHWLSSEVLEEKTNATL
ncbi:methanogenic corrinoid protein MtbC1 [Bacillus ectoiniformans]|nr:methanogenic corrinoid protein MtbC1 [Bacillus ectoiniformans]